jgi:hypothetical protein
VSSFRREHGFWAAVSGLKIKELFSAEILLGTLIGACIATLQLLWGDDKSRSSVAGDFLAITSALLGVVFAAFALLVAFFSPSYVALLNSLETGVKGFLQPFLLAIGVQVLVIVSTVTYRALPAATPDWIEVGGFYLLAVFFGAALLDVVALARSVLIHGVLRAKHETAEARKRDKPPPM